ncbi:MAG: lipoprotein-releasing ABC transporter permease subunit [Gammaproteobacteria bacterium]|jgi:lipoprotein-releasing system permease protein
MFRPLEMFVGLRYLRARRRSQFVSFISLMSLLGVAIGVAALIVVLSVMNGFENELRQRLLAMTSHGAISGPDGRLSDWPAVRSRAMAVSGVEAAAPFVEIAGMLGNGASLKAAVVRGIDPALEAGVSRVSQHLLAGQLSDLQPGSGRLILGRLLAAQLGLAPGDTVVLMVPRGEGANLVPRLRRFEVAGLFEVGMEEYDGLLALAHLDDAAGALGLGQEVTGVRIELANMFTAPEVTRELAARLGPGYSARDWTEENASYFRAVRIEKTMMTIILLLVVAVAAFNIVATLVMVVTDKRSEIAIFRTLGLTPGAVMRVFLVQGVIIGLIGTALGGALGVPLALNIETIASQIEALFGLQFMPADVYYIARLPSEVRWPDVYAILGLAFVLCSLATLYPAWRAAQVQPAEALRYDHH